MFCSKKLKINKFFLFYSLFLNFDTLKRLFSFSQTLAFCYDIYTVKVNLGNKGWANMITNKDREI